jgi:hypothetical protein
LPLIINLIPHLARVLKEIFQDLLIHHPNETDFLAFYMLVSILKSRLLVCRTDIETLQKEFSFRVWIRQN